MQDPDGEVETWYVNGSPLGIAARPEGRNVFPAYTDIEAAAHPSTIASELGGKGRRTRADSHPEAVKEMDAMVKRRWVDKYFSKALA